MAAHEKSPRSLAARGALQKLATGEASNCLTLPQIAPASQEDCPRCASGGCAYFREITTKKGGISRICQFHGHKVAAADLACDHFPGQPWVYGGNDA